MGTADTGGDWGSWRGGDGALTGDVMKSSKSPKANAGFPLLAVLTPASSWADELLGRLEKDVVSAGADCDCNRSPNKSCSDPGAPKLVSYVCEVGTVAET